MVDDTDGTREADAGRATPVGAALSRLAVLIAYLGFASLSLPDGLLGVAWPTMHVAFGIPLGAMGALLTATTVGYMVSSFGSPLWLRYAVGARLAAGTGIVACGVASIGLFRIWLVALFASFVIGSGSGLVDVSLNGFASGRADARLMTRLHASFGFGATLSPLILVAAMQAGSSWWTGYVTIGLLLAGLAGLFAATAARWGDGSVSASSGPRLRALAVLSLPSVPAGMIAFFVYSGLEMTVGQWSYTFLREYRAVGIALAGVVTSAFWFFLSLSRLFVERVVARWGLARTISSSLLLSFLSCLLLAVPGVPSLSVLAILLLGVGLGPVYPLMMFATSKRVDAGATATVVAYQVGAAGLGLALLPALGGILLDWLGPGSLLTLMIVASALLVILQSHLHRAANPFR